jgi:hypothetical protein
MLNRLGLGYVMLIGKCGVDVMGNSCVADDIGTGGGGLYDHLEDEG